MNAHGLLFSICLYRSTVTMVPELPSERWKKWFMRKGYKIDVAKDWYYLEDMWECGFGEGEYDF